jgi:ATP-dependent Clp protease ATP-binding subunit ClpA
VRLRRRPTPPPLWRFDGDAAAAVHEAEREARTLGHASMGSGHVLLALAAGETRAGTALLRLGVDEDAVRLSLQARLGAERRPGLDPDALATLGIDLDEVRRRVEESFGTGALERAANGTNDCLGVSPRLKQAFAQAADQATADEQLVTPARLLLALADIDGGLAAKVLAEHGVDAAALRAELDALD